MNKGDGTHDIISRGTIKEMKSSFQGIANMELKIMKNSICSFDTGDEAADIVLCIDYLKLFPKLFSCTQFFLLSSYFL